MALMTVAAIGIAACGGDDKSAEPPQELEDTIGFGGDSAKEVQARVENRIGECMRAQGFQYQPVDPFAAQQAVTGKARITDEEFTRQFGYGISTLFGKGNQQSDPNERIRSSLSSADRAAYDRALGGDNPGVTFAEAVDSGDFSELGGCTKEASDAEFGGAAVLNQLVERLDGLDERIIQDQRMVQANEKWSACMQEKGYRYEEPDAIDEDMTERFQAIAGSGIRPGTSTIPPGTSFDRAALTSLQQEEVRIANADLDCEKQEIEPVEREVRPQYEDQFRKENQQLLARVKPATANQ
ncbi:MAG TPA: hypothetical protein VFB51_10900 [Solirubrobacterales bacterium]|nr:hypothetical protein [Solirubrobacterales bacterium]